MTNTPNTLADVAIKAATAGAIEYIKTHNLKVDFAFLSESLRAMTKARLPEALHDAKAALDANMGQIAEQTFLASMVLAGVEAAKESCYV
jgi:hypothetical protein